MNIKFPKFKIIHIKTLINAHKITLLIFLGLTAILAFSIFVLNSNLTKQNKQNIVLSEKLKDVSLKLKNLENQDQYKINQQLKGQVSNIETSYKSSVDLYQRILDFKAQKKDTSDLDKE